ncbi:MAG: FkbM family methyltransferase [Candidatus Hodarchaeota archaeon]
MYEIDSSLSSNSNGEFFKISKFVFLTKLALSLKIYPLLRKINNYMPWKLSYHNKLMNFYSKFINKGDLCFDVGSNVGDITKILSNLGARIISIEPQKKCIKFLKIISKRNKNIILVGKAVGDRVGFGEIFICKDDSGYSTMSKKMKHEGRFSSYLKWGYGHKIPVTTLDTLISEYGCPKYCKIDVEGYEEFIFKGLTKKIPIISFEFHREFFKTAKNCINHLQALGYKEFNCVIAFSTKFLLNSWVRPEKLYKQIRMLNYRFLEGHIYAKLP